MLDSLINKYQGIHETLFANLQEVAETDEIPFADVEGAPSTVEAALHGIMGMLFAVEQVLNDLNIMRMEMNLNTVADGSDN